MPEPPEIRRGRSDSPEVAELKRIKADNPDLASAADLHIGLLDLHRRVQSRTPVPWIEADPAWLKEQHAAGIPLLRFEDIPLNWTDFRLLFRETAGLLRRAQALEEEDFQRMQLVVREEEALHVLARRWYNAAAHPELTATASDNQLPDSIQSEMIDQVLLFAMRPFLARCAETLLPRLDLSTWTRGRCPLCGGEPDFAVITQSAERLLICGRCTARWRFDSLACPFCRNADRQRITSFTSRDGLYRIYGCDACQRYIKAYDGRRSRRPVMIAADSVATLPLDAAAMQKGYH